MSHGKLRAWALFALINLFGFGLLGLATLKGWVQLVVVRDTSGICLTIFGLFLVGLVLSFLRIRALNQSFDDLEANKGSWLTRYRDLARKDPSSATEALKAIFGAKVIWIYALLTVLPGLGLLGTVVGITMGLEGGALTSTTKISEVVEPLFFQLMAGLAVAFYTTIVGMIFMLWTLANLKLLESESLYLMAAVLEAGHADAEKAGTVKEDSPKGDSAHG